MIISYDGTDFAGWQVQSKDRSVQGDLEQALSELHGTKVRVTGAGRTDSGVHAVGQTGNFYSNKSNIPAERFRDAINAYLPQDIRILSSCEVPSSFHSRRDAVCRVYEYRLIEGLAIPPHLSRYIWCHRKLPSLGLLNDLASCISGVHDFSTFSAAGDSVKSHIREIFHAVFLREGPVTVFRIAGNAFLWRMVRSLLGTIVDLAQDSGTVQDMRRILESRKRDLAGPTAPPRGLFLTKVIYGTDTGVR